VAQDISIVSKHLKGPIMMLGGIGQLGEEYARELFTELRAGRIKNHVAFELLRPPTKDILEMMAASIHNFNIQMSPETHDEKIRRAFGKGYTNKDLEETINNALELGCRRVDLFFMIGLPGQTPDSVHETVEYCESLLRSYRREGRALVHPYISPLAPFLDPGSRAFENPHKYGYELLHKTLEEHREALLAPSWKYMLNYQTRWMKRDELVACTYQATLALNRLKVRYGLMTRKQGAVQERRIREAMDLTARIDEALFSQDGTVHDSTMQRLGRGYGSLRRSTNCEKKDLRWPVSPLRFNLPRIIRAVLARD